MIAALANAFVPIFAGLVVGYLAGVWKLVDNQNVRTLIIFLMNVALPCALFSSVDHLSRPALQQQAQLAIVLGVTYLVAFTAFADYVFDCLPISAQSPAAQSCLETPKICAIPVILPRRISGLWIFSRQNLE